MLGDLIKIKRPLIIIVLAGVAVNFINLSFPFLIQAVIDSSVRPTIHSPVFWLILAGAIVLGGIIGFFRRYMIAKLISKIDLDFTSELMQKILRVQLRSLRSETMGNWAVAMEQVQRIKWNVAEVMGQVFFDLLLVLGYLVVFFTYDPRLSLMYLFLSLFTFFIIKLAANRFRQHYETAMQAKSESESHILESLNNAELIRHFRLSDWIFNRWVPAYRNYVQTTFKAEIWNSVVSVFMDVFRRAAPLLLVVWKLPALSDGSLTIGAMVALTSMVSMGLDPFLSLAEMNKKIQETILGYERIRGLRKHPEESGESDGPVQLTNEIPGLEIEQLGFRYEPAGPWVFRGLNLSVSEGSLAIVGASGSGKSTLLRLIMRLYPFDEGKIKLAGRDLNDFSPTELRSLIGLMGQETGIITGSILENIVLSDPSPDIERAIDCLKRAGALEFISALPDQYRTQIRSDAHPFSVGQKQRIAIARILYTDPRILLLDEPTSALDLETAMEISETLKIASSGRITVMVTHHLKMASQCDRICFIRPGSKQEIGTHQELLARESAYARLWKIQTA